MKELIINDVQKTVVADAANKTLIIKRGANYDLTKICGPIYKTLPVDGTPGSVTVDLSSVGTASVKNNYMFKMFVKMGSRQLADFALANWAEFGKPVLVEVEATGKGAPVAEAIEKALKVVAEGDNKFFTVSRSGATLTITAENAYLGIDSVAVAEFDANAVVNSQLGDYKDVLVIEPGNAVITPAVEPFGTAQWIRENLRFPSYPNLRYEALYADEQPVAGAKYVQYAFEYLVKKAVPGGMSAVGQVVDSLTQHIIYVREDLASAFEAVLATANGSAVSFAASNAHADGTHATEDLEATV